MKFKNYIETESGIKDTSTSPGTAGQVLSSTVTGTSWIDPDTLVSAASKLVVIACKNVSGTPILKGTPVYQSGTVGATDVIEVEPADAIISTGYLPAIGILQTTLNNNGFGNVVITGEFLNYSTSGIPSNNPGGVPITGDTVYLAAGGGLTCIKPTGAGNAIQNLGLIGKVSGGNAGSITVASIMRANDVPNLPEGRIWIGDGNTIVSDTVYVDEPNGRVGIGTTTPLGAIQIGDGAAASPSTNQIIVLSNTATTGGSSNLYLATGASGTSTIGMGSTQFSPTNTAGKIIYSDIVDTFSFNTNFSTKMVINGSGDVGIGETNPGAKLEVVGTTGVIIDSGSSSAAKLTLKGDGSPFGGGASIDVIGGSNDYLSYILNIKRSPSTLEASNSYFQYNAGWEWNGNQSNSRAQPYTSYSFRSQGSSQMVIYNNNLGIGVTTPSQKLHVNGNARVTGSYYDSSNSPGAANSVLISTISGTVWGARGPLGGGTTNYLARWTPDGNTLGIGVTYDNGTNVGIGTTSPGTYKLAVAGSTAIGGNVEVLDGLGGDRVLSLTANNGYFSIGDIDGLGDQAFISGDSSSISISTNQTTTLHCDSNNRVGIGTTIPGAKLDVVQNTAPNGAAALHLIGPQSNPGLTSSVLIIEQSDGKKITIDGNDIDVSSGDLFINDYSREDVTFGGQIKVTGGGSPVGDSYFANGNVGIGTTNPNAKLEISGHSNSGKFLLIDNVALGDTFLNVEDGLGSQLLQIKRETDNTISFNSYNDFNFIDNVGIKQTNPLHPLDVNGEIHSSTYVSATAGLGVDNTSGQLGRGISLYGGPTLYPQYGLLFAQTVDLGTYGGVSGDWATYMTMSGTATRGWIWKAGTTNSTAGNVASISGVGQLTLASTATATNFILSSDETLKDNIKEIDTKHVDVDWKNFELKSEPGIKRAGVIAQELEIKHPEFVRTADDGLKSVAYIDLLITKIAELEARLEKLEK